MFTFKQSYFFFAILLFMVEVLIALYVKDRFVRPYVGDVLVVILIYCFVRSFIKLPIFTMAVAVLIFAFSVECLQYYGIVYKLGLQGSAIARTVIGTSFEWIDLIAYTIGTVIVLITEKYLLKKDLLLA